MLIPENFILILHSSRKIQLLAYTVLFLYTEKKEFGLYKEKINMWIFALIFLYNCVARRALS